MRRRALSRVAGAVLCLAPLAVAGPVGATTTTTSPLGPSGDPLQPKQWGLITGDVPKAWASGLGTGVIIGVVDTGVDLAHEDLAGKVIASTNCIGANGSESNCQGTAQDDNGHGTHVSGIAAADTGNGKGIAGVAPGAKVVVAKALDANGGGSVSDVNTGIEWVVDHGAKVVNLSLGDAATVLTGVIGTSLQDGIEYAWSHGAIPVLAAGNSNLLGFGSSNYGSLDAVVVGAVGRDGSVAGYSSPTGNAKWALLAPGGSADGTAADDVLSTYWIKGMTNQYAFLAGTSMATPFVAGTLAMLLSAGLTPAQAVSRLLTTVNAHVGCGNNSTNCHGLLDAGAAMAGLGGPQKPPPTTAPPTTVKVTPASTLPAVLAPPATITPAPVMNADPQSHGGPKPTTAPTSSTAPAAGTNATSHQAGTAATAALAPSSSRGGGGSFIWFAVLAGLFLAAGGGGVLWMIRTSPGDAEV